MSSPPNPIAGKILPVPVWLKNLYDWTKILGIPVAVLAFLSSFFIGPSKGVIIGSLVTGFGVVSFVVILIVKNAFQAVELAGTAVADYDKWSADQRKGVLDGMNASKIVVIFWTVVLALVAVVAVACLLVVPVYHGLFTKTPDKIELANVIYFDASQESLVQSSPVIEAIITSLKEEAKASGVNERIILGTTKPFGTPTPAFRFRVTVTDDNLELSTYAFLTRKEQSNKLFQTVLSDYTEKNSVILSVPASEAGDEVFFVGRLSLAPGKSDFPSDPKKILDATIVAGDKHL
jgi:hypothetical protein